MCAVGGRMGWRLVQHERACRFPVGDPFPDCRGVGFAEFASGAGLWQPLAEDVRRVSGTGKTRDGVPAFWGGYPAAGRFDKGGPYADRNPGAPGTGGRGGTAISERVCGL